MDFISEELKKDSDFEYQYRLAAKEGKIQRWINERPRETLGFKTPIEAIKELFSNLNVALAS